ncbi:MAG: MFS transporter, partial [Wenzhouxiangella sp.]
MNDNPQPRGLPPAGRFALLAALCSSVGQTFFIGLFGSDFRAEFGLSDAAFGTLYSAATLGGGLLMFWLGGLADRFTLRRSVLLVLGMLALGALLVSAAQTVALLLAGLFLVRLAGQGLMGHLGVVAAGRFAVRRRGRALAMVSYGFILGEASL